MANQPKDPKDERTTELEAELKERQAQIRGLEQDLTTLQAQVEKLTADLKKFQAELPQFPLESLTSSFKALLENTQVEALKATPSGTAGVLRSIDVELKGFVNVQDSQTQFVVPRAGDVVDAQSLSLLKLSFVTVPTRPLPPKPPTQPPTKAPEEPPAEPSATESAADTGKRRRKRSRSQ